MERQPIKKVSFSRNNIRLVGNLYFPSNYREQNQYNGIIVSGSMTSVKEQMPAVYAEQLAKDGFFVLAFDYSGFGESEGQPRQYEDYRIKLQDHEAAVTFLQSVPGVKGVAFLGICTSGGNAAYLAAADKRVGAFATVAGWFAEPSLTPTLYGGQQRVEELKTKSDAAKKQYETTGTDETILAYHSTDKTASHLGPMEYYMDKTRGGGVKEWKNEFAVMSWRPWLEFNPVNEASKITTPAMVIHSDGCALPEQAKKFYNDLKDKKELVWGDGYHFDYYDQPKQVRFAVQNVSRFFRQHLKPQQNQGTNSKNAAVIATVQKTFAGSDERDWQKVESAFADTVLLDYSSLSGASASTLAAADIIKAWQGVLPGFYSTHHQVGNFAVNVNGNRATASAHGLALHYLPNDTRNNVWVVVGTYNYTLQKQGDTWRINALTFNLQKQSGNLQLPQLAQQRVKEGKTAKRPEVSNAAKASVDAFFTALERLDVPAFMNAWSDDGRQIMPLSPDGFPKELKDKAAIQKQYSGLPESYASMSFPRKIFATDDPNTFIVQYTGRIPLKDGGEYNNNYVGLFTLKGGKVQRFTEYFDPFILQEAFGSKLQSNFNVSGGTQQSAGATGIRKVAFSSEGLVLKGNLYLPNDFNESKKYKALVVTGSWTTVKEQMPALYAQKMADSGYVALTFDFRHFGESEGQPREYENPAEKIKDIQAAVTFLTTLRFVDGENIAGLGVCASTGYMSHAAAADTRIKTVVLVAPWLHNAALIETLYGSRPGGVKGLMAKSDAAEKRFAETGNTTHVEAASATNDAAAMYLPDPAFDYYLNPQKGAVPAWKNNFAEMSWKPWLTFNGINASQSLRQPVLVVHSENGAVPEGAKQFYEQVKSEKKFVWVDKKWNQLDMYYVPDAINEATAPVFEWLKTHLN